MMACCCWRDGVLGSDKVRRGGTDTKGEWLGKEKEAMDPLTPQVSLFALDAPLLLMACIGCSSCCARAALVRMHARMRGSGRQIGGGEEDLEV